MDGRLRAAFEAHFNPEQLVIQGIKDITPDQLATIQAWWLAGAIDLFNAISSEQPRDLVDMARIMMGLMDEIDSFDRRDDLREISSRN
jgi:hypothetical protein